VDVGKTHLGKYGTGSCPVAVGVTSVDYLYFAISSLLVTRFLPSLVWGLKGELVRRAALRTTNKRLFSIF